MSRRSKQVKNLYRRDKSGISLKEWARANRGDHQVAAWLRAKGVK